MLYTGVLYTCSPRRATSDVVPSQAPHTAPAGTAVGTSDAALAAAVAANAQPHVELLGGLCLANRANVDPSLDALRLIVTGRSNHRLYVYRRTG